MTCAEFVELVTDYLEDALSVSDRERFDRHLAECPHCERYLEQLRLVVAELGTLPEERLREPARSELLQAFRNWSR